jgi:hypothetical protein
MVGSLRMIHPNADAILCHPTDSDVTGLTAISSRTVETWTSTFSIAGEVDPGGQTNRWDFFDPLTI